jgi:hypothetical protein
MAVSSANRKLTQYRLFGIPVPLRQNSQCVDQAEMIEPAIGDSRMIGVSQQVVDAIRAEDVAANDLIEDGFSGVKGRIRVFRAYCDFCDVGRLDLGCPPGWAATLRSGSDPC